MRIATRSPFKRGTTTTTPTKKRTILTTTHHTILKQPRHRSKINAVVSLICTCVIGVTLVYTNTSYTNSYLMKLLSLQTDFLAGIYYSRIPQHILFLDTRYDTIHDVPSPFQETIQDTVQKYCTLWGDDIMTSQTYINHYDNMQTLLDSPRVWYLNNEGCINVIQQVEPELVPYFESETTIGQDKADICRVAALYLRGGYYFDTDMPTVKAISMDPYTSFMSPWESEKWGELKGIFNSFIAVAPGHPILKKNIELFLEAYRGSLEYHILGPALLYQSVLNFTGMTANEAQRIPHGANIYENNFDQDDIRSKWPLDLSLAEVLLSDEIYPDLPRYENIEKEDFRCHYVVHNVFEEQVYFFSRMPGAGANCHLKHRIPRQIVFVEPKYQLMEELSEDLQTNVNYVKLLVRDLWEDTDDGIKVLFNDECGQVIHKVESRLYSHYMNAVGEVKKKICRLSYLYDKGGFYHDTDIQSNNLMTLNPESSVSLVQPIMHAPNSISKSYVMLESSLAVAPRHPMIRIQLDHLLDDFINRGKSRKFFGLAVKSTKEEELTLSYQGKILHGDSGAIRAFKEFLEREERKGYRLADWKIDFRLF